jgi:N-acetylmuramoyl-L-alanine amidase
LKKYYNQNIIFFFFTTLFFATNSFASPNQVTKIFTTKQSDQNRLKFELTKPTKYRVFTISNPNRLVVDLDDCTLSKNIKNFSDPLFSSARNSINNQGQLRIVFDLIGGTKVKNSSIIRYKNNKYYLVINLLPNNASNTETSQDSDQIMRLLDKETGTVKYIVKKPKPLPIIIIDPGHGGKDPGTIGKYARSKEKYVTLGYARELKRQLDKTKKFKVFLTRDKDYFIPLNERVGIARRMKADLFISLHADSSPNRNTSGLSIYSLSETSSDKQAELLARKENKSDIIGGADFSDARGDILKTLINLLQRNTMNDSAKFAEIVIKSIRKSKVETLQRTHRFAGFRVLTAPDVPSVLIELGYLSNRDEERKLNSLKHKKQVAQALVEAINEYFLQIK